MFKTLPYITFLIFFNYNCKIFSQTIPDTWTCGVTTSASNPPNYSYKPFQTPVLGEPLKILIVYVTFSNDEAYPLFDNFWWPPNEIPQSPRRNGGSILAADDVPYNSDFMNMYPEYSISDYFCEMSMGKFDVVGDEVIVNLPQTDTYYQALLGNRGNLNQYVLQSLDPNWDFSVYDNWDFDENTNSWVYQDDGYIDMMVICYRNFPNGSNWAFGGASGWWNLDNITFNVDGKTVNGGFSEYGSGITVTGGLMNYSNVTGAIQHEIFHYLMHSNGTYGNHNSSGLMTGLGEMSFCMNPWERSLSYIGWTNTTNIESTGIYNFTLQDYIKGGQILKVVLPNTDNEDFYVINSQRVSLYDGIIRGGNANWIANKNQQNPYCPVGKGIYIYHNTPVGSNRFEFCVSGTYDKEFDLVNAEGKYDWIKIRDVNYYVPGHNFTIPLFEPINGNVFSGKEEYHHWIKLSNACMQKEVTDDPCNSSEDADDYVVTSDDLGDEKDAFNFGYDEIFSPYSNPSTKSIQEPLETVPLTLKINGYNETNGNIDLTIYYNSENQAIQDLPPSKPKNIKATKHVVEPISGRFQPKVTWDPNTEPDFADGGKYRIYRGVQYVCDREVEPTYSYIGEVNAGTEEFIDYTIYLYPRSGGSGICEYQFRSLSYKIEAIDNSNKTSLKSDRSIVNGYAAPCDPVDGNNSSIITGLPQEFKIYNYPNPFNPVTHIKYELPQNTFVTIIIYNVLGETVKTLINHEYMASGKYRVFFDGINLSSGIYYYSIEAGVYKEVKKMVLLK